MKPLVVAIVGAGPSGIYAAEALTAQSEIPVQVAVIDKLPVPFGLVRYGVAPDHPSIRSIRNTLERTLERDDVSFFGNVAIGRDITVEELRSVTDAVIYAYGAASDRRLDVEGEDLAGSIAAPDLVAWYCGNPDVHPETSGGDDHRYGHNPIEELITRARQAVVVGAGNVALDVLRVLIKEADELDETDMADEVLSVLAQKSITDVHLLARRGPAYTAFTTKELREIAKIENVDLLLDPADFDLDQAGKARITKDKVAARNVAAMQDWLDRPITGAPRRIHLHFWTRPVRILGSDRVEAVEVERTRLNDTGRVVAAGPLEPITAQLVVRSVGYRGIALDGIPYDQDLGRVPHADGHVIREDGFSPDEYVTGWIKRGPTGVIGTNKSDAVETVHSLLNDVSDEALMARHDIAELTSLLADRGIRPLDLPAWQRIDAAEMARGQGHGRDRTTIVHHSELLAAATDPD
ncbi:FAD-dependent oxidoreductase [Microlunatus sp. Gsoil 973]|uniref:FAD-dependent oxidoreductase n=1 Tax=Microlunatus sp. Gsoil 973 TaxID=2672569 RepID=UPI0012B4B352|nr:FAD-dependent oxidoreductase [Microlunatus sp. Gsoil 973]QGN31672.1 NADP oxidoreductase [Microlunatus sp. Gsoil 973]